MHDVTTESIGRAESANANSLKALIAALAAMGWLFYAAFRKTVPGWSFLLPLPLALAAGRWHGKNRGKWLRLIRLRKLHERAVERMEDRWPGNGYSGLDFRVPHHVYDVDLQVLGEGSLFELICTTRTEIGRRELAGYLLNPCGIDEAKARQAAVRELAPQNDLRERVQLLGEFAFQESTWGVFADWVAEPEVIAPGWIRAIALFCSVSLFCMTLAGFATNVPWSMLTPWILPVAASQMALAWSLRTKTARVNSAASRVGVEIGVVREGMELIAGSKLQSEKLLAIQRRLSDAGAAAILRKLERLTNALAEFEKEWFSLPAQALALRTQVCFAIVEWKVKYAGQLEGWLEAWGEFEALMAISGYAWEHQSDSFPEFADEGTSFAARDLGHPLLPGAGCVRNCVTLDAGNRFYVISGSNMAGKSTLLRSIGLNVILAKVGAPVRASWLRLSHLEVFASLSIVDSILEGKSKFLSEVERIRKMLECAREAPVLFLIDEILSGTNSRDRRVASEAVIRELVGNGAIGALSTHDLALTEIVSLAGMAGLNVHMGAGAGNDPMAFDYLLKPGVTRETNALAIAAMMGVPGL